MAAFYRTVIKREIADSVEKDRVISKSQVTKRNDKFFWLIFCIRLLACIQNNLHEELGGENTISENSDFYKTISQILLFTYRLSSTL